MTGPIAHDYPDWGRSVSASDVVVHVVNNQVLNAQLQTGYLFVGNLPYLSIFLFCAGANARIRLEWAGAADGTLTMESDEIVTRAAGRTAMTIPAAGPYVRLTYDLSAYPNALNARVVMSPVPRALTTEGTGAPVLTRVTNQAVGIGATVNLDVTVTQSGPAVLSVVSSLVTWECTLQALSMSGALSSFAEINQAANGLPQYVFLPPNPVRVSFSNTTGVAGTFDAYLTALHRGAD